jgi:hypothetical protein
MLHCMAEVSVAADLPMVVSHRILPLCSVLIYIAIFYTPMLLLTGGTFGGSLMQGKRSHTVRAAASQWQCQQYPTPLQQAVSAVLDSNERQCFTAYYCNCVSFLKLVVVTTPW